MIVGTLTVLTGRELVVSGQKYTLPIDGKVIKGTWPNYRTIGLDDLKVGARVALHGPPRGDLHSVRLL